MEQSPSAAMLDAPTRQREEEYVLGMEQRSKSIPAMLRDAPAKSKKEEHAGHTGKGQNAVKKVVLI